MRRLKKRIKTAWNKVHNVHDGYAPARHLHQTLASSLHKQITIILWQIPVKDI